MDSKVIPFPLVETAEEFTPVPPAMVEWVSILDLLNPEQHGLGALEIATVEVFCWYATLGFSSANFVARTHDGRRFHLQGALDEDAGPDITAVCVVKMPDDERLPFPPDEKDLSTHWSAETDAFNAELERVRVGRAPVVRSRA